MYRNETLDEFSSETNLTYSKVENRLAGGQRSMDLAGRYTVSRRNVPNWFQNKRA